MSWPTSQDYNEAIQDPATSFSDPGLKGGEAVVNALGLPVPRSGNFADVYQFTDAAGKAWALKCFTRKVPGLRERYVKIDEHLAKARLPFTVGFKFLQEGVRIRGEWYPLLKMEWVEGFTLNDFVAKNLDKPHHLHALMQMWAKLAARLRDANMAHADLQHGNVLLVPGATPQKLGLKLIDYDGMWVPALAENPPGEVGHPNFQHPLRLKERLYNGDVDRFPHLVIAAALRATLIGGQALWEKFDNGDNLLFKESDLRDPANGPVFKALWELNDPVLRTLVGHIALSAKQPLRKTPWLDDVLFETGGPKLTAEQERQVCDLLGVTTAAPAGAKSAPPAAVEQEFNVFQFLDEDVGPTPAAERSGINRRPVSRRAPVKKSKAPFLVGGGIAAALLVAVAVVALTMGGKKAPTPEVALHKEKEKDEGPKAIDPNRGGPPKVGGGDPIKPANEGKEFALKFAPPGTVELQKTQSAIDLNGNFTIETWVRWPANFKGTLRFVGNEAWPGMANMGAVPRTCGWVLRTSDLKGNESRSFDFTVAAEPGEWLGVLSPVVNAPGDEWHHIAVCKSGDRIRLFLDGGQIADKGTRGINFVAGPTDLYMGRRKDLDGAQLGEVKGVRVTSRGRYLGPFKPDDTFKKDVGTEVVLDFSAGDGQTIADLSGKGHDGVLKDVQWMAIEEPKEATPPSGSREAPIAVAANPAGRDYLFVRRDDPTLYTTTDGTAQKAKPVGKFSSPIRALAMTTDGSVAVTGGEDGMVGIWNLKADAGAPAVGGPQKKTLITSFKIDKFNGQFSCDVYQENIVVHDHANKRDATVPVVAPGQPLKPDVATYLESNPGFGDRFGQAMTGDFEIFNGDLTVWVFEGGVRVSSKASKDVWQGWHAKRKAAGTGVSRADHVWIDDELPPGAKPIVAGGNLPWTFIDKTKGPVHSGEKSIKLTAESMQQNYFTEAAPGLLVNAGDVLFAYVYLDPKSPPEEVMMQWHSAGVGALARAYWGPAKIEWGGKMMGELPKPGKWVRLEMKADELGIKPGAMIDNFALAQFGGTAYWDTIGINTGTPQGGAKPDAPAAAPYKALKGHTGPVLAAAISPNGQRAVTLGKDTRVCVWDLAGARLVGKFEVPGACCVTYTHDENQVIIGTENQSAAVWDVIGQKSVHNLPGHTSPVRAACVSPPGDLAWTAGEDGKLKNWKLPNFVDGGFKTADRQGIAALAVSPDGRMLACAGRGGSVHFISPKSGASMGNHVDRLPVTGLAFINGGDDIVVARDDQLPLVIHLDRKGANPPPDPSPPPPATVGGVLKLLQEADVSGGLPRRMGYRPDGKYLWMSNENSMTVADGDTGREIKSWPVEGEVWHAAFGPDTKLYLVIAGGRFQVWDWEKGVRLRDYDPAEQPAPRPAYFWAAHAPNRLLVTTNSPYMLLWDVAKWKEVERFMPYPNEVVTLAAPYPGGARCAAYVAGRDGPRLVVWDAVERREAFRLTGVEVKNLLRLDVSPGGRWVVALWRDASGGQVSVWDGRTGKHARTVPGVKTSNFGGGFSPGGDHYVYCEQAGRRWDINLANGQLTDESRGQKTSMAAAAAPAAGLFATADNDRRIRIWRIEVDTKPGETVRKTDPKTPVPTTTPAEKEGFLKDSAELSDTVTSCVVSSDGKKIFAATRKGIVHVLDAATAEESSKLDVSKVRLLHMVLAPKNTNASSGVTIPDRLYILDDDRHLHTWEPDKPTKIRDVNLEKSGLPNVSAGTRLVIAPNESYLLVFDPDGTEGYSWVPGRWTTTAIPPALQRPPFNTRTRCVAYSADGLVGAAYASRKLVVWRQRAAKDIRFIDTTVNAAWVGLALDAGVVAVADSDRLQAWKYEAGTEVLNVRYPHGVVGTYFAATTPTGLITAGSDRWLRVWDLRTGKEATRWRLEQAPRGVTVSPDGRTAVVWYEDTNKVGLWALPDLKGKK